MTAVIKKSGTGAAQARCVSPLKPCLSHFAARHQFLKLRLQHAVKASEAAVQDAVTAELLQWMQHNGCAIQGVALQYEESNGQLSRELRAAKVCCCSSSDSISNQLWLLTQKLQAIVDAKQWEARPGS